MEGASWLGHLTPLQAQIRRNVQGPHAPAVVASGHITGLAVARSLGRRGVPTVVLDREATGVAFQSRFTSASGTVPDPTTQEEAYVEALLEVGEALPERGVLLATNDDWLLPMLRARRRLEEHFVLPVADAETVARILDKVELYRAADRLGVAVPATWEVTEETWQAVRDEARYPLVLKPAHQRPFYDAFGEKVVRVADSAAFEAAWRRTRPHVVVAQEEVLEPRFVSIGSYLDRSGAALGAFAGEKLAQYPAGFGTACHVRTLDAPELVEEGVRLLRALGYHGVSELEYLFDARDDAWKVIDINTRTWKWIGLGAAAGVDLPWIAYRDALGQTVQPATGAGGTDWLHTQDYLRLRAEGSCTDDALDTGDWLRLLAGDGAVDAVHDPDDPAPLAQLLANAVRPRSYSCPC